MKEKTIVLDGGTIALQNWGPLAFLASQMLCEDLIYDVIFVYRDLLCIVLEFGFYVIILNNLCS